MKVVRYGSRDMKYGLMKMVKNRAVKILYQTQ